MSMLRLGSSKPWKEVIEVMTGKPEMDTSAFREYFAPLEKWLREENARSGVKVGWKVDDYGQFCRGPSTSSASAGKTVAMPAAILAVLSAILASRCFR